MTLPPDLWQAGAAQLAAAIRAREVSAREAVEAQLARIEAVNPRLNAVTVVLAEQALTAAGRADDALARGEETGPLHGVPCTIKENIEVAGTATTNGVPALAEAYAERDAPAVERLREAGAIVVGRTNLPDLGMRWHTASSLRGVTRNPWDAGRTAGGSSGGEAAALAAGMTPLGLGNDYGGSLRYPSQCCGTAALKPGYGRIATAPREGWPDPTPTGDLFTATGPMARHVADLRLAFAVLAAPDSRDPRLAPAPLDGTAGERPRVAFTSDPGGLGVDERVAAGVRRAAEALADAGYRVEEGEPLLLREATEVWGRLADAELQSAGQALLEPLSDEARRFIELTTWAAPEPSLAGYLEAHMERFRCARVWSEWFGGGRLLLGPVSTAQAFPVGHDIEDGEQALGVRRSMRLTLVANLLGLPSVALPAGVDGGLPQGVQIIGPRYREELCLTAAQAIEDRLGVITPIEPRGAGLAGG